MTSTITSTQLDQVLSDYTLHLTGYDDSTTGNRSTTSQSEVLRNPANWPTNHYRIPPYRPVNRNLDPAERPRGSNPAEFVFINVMFTGVFLNASLAKLWGMTGGKRFPDLFKYAVGGEW